MKHTRFFSSKLMRVAFVLVLVSAGNAFAAGNVTRVTNTAFQETVKNFKGVVVKRDPDSFTMSETTDGTIAERNQTE